jgi:hypothetical protein
MRLASDIWLADLARAVTALQPADDHTVEAVIGQLGIGASLDSGRPQPPDLPGSGKEKPDSESQRPAGLDFDTGADEHQGDVRDENTERMEVLEPVGRVTDDLSKPWMLAADLEEVSERHLQGVRSYEPLFVRSWSRELMAAAVAQQVPGNRADERRLVDLVARARPVTEIPRRPRWSLSLGVQLLVDIGEGMEPFARDQSELADGIRHIVGNSRVALLRFRDCPVRGAGDGPIWTWKPYRPPEPGCPVLVLTDLGIGGPRVHPERSRPSEWVALASWLRRRSSTLIAFVPYGQDRWPDRLRKVITVVQWDRATTVASIHARHRSPPTAP